MNLYEFLVSKYPSGTVSPQNFVEHLTIGADGWIGAWIAVALAVVFGLLVYIIPIYLTEKDHVGPYPLWLHCFYCAADFMGIWVFLEAWKTTDHFPLFLLLSIGEGIWVLMELYSLYRAITYEAEINWKPGTAKKKMIIDICIMTILCYVSLNLLRAELHDDVMWKFWIFTQVLICTIPGLTLEKRGTRKGHNLVLHISFICVAVISFNPWCNMWLAIAPEFFAPAENPWYYITGCVCLILAIRGLITYLHLPPKEAVEK